MTYFDKTDYVYNNKKLLGEYLPGNYVDYIYAGDLLVAINKNGTVYYVHNDHLNTPNLNKIGKFETCLEFSYFVINEVTNNNNAIVFDWPAVDPFGANPPIVNTIDFNIRYPGQYYDSETAYHYNYHRYYNPQTGKYLQADPIDLQGGYNLYNYVDNNSLTGIDPEGLQVDLNYFSYREPQYSAAENYKSKPDWFSVAGHGNPKGGIHDSRLLTSLTLPAGKKMVSIPVKLLSRFIMNHPRYTKGMGVELLGCFTGVLTEKESEQYAQNLSNILQAPVRGTDNFIWFFPDGRVQINGLISDPIINKEIIDEKRPGKFKIFYPK